MRSNKHQHTPRFVVEDKSFEESLSSKSPVIARPLFLPDQTIQYFGSVNASNNEHVFDEIKTRMHIAPDKELYMIVTSNGGSTGCAMSFYDTMQYVLRPNLITIGSGDVDTSSMLLLLAGQKRFVTKNTTALLHLASRSFDSGRKYTASEMESMAKEDRIKDEQYAYVLSDRGKNITTREVLEIMEENTILTPRELLALGLIDGILE